MQFPASAADIVDPDQAAAPDEVIAALESKIANLEMALSTSRIIGMAIGVVMERCKVGQESAFELLVTVSQEQHRKVRDVAQELVFTGAIPAKP